MTDNLKFTLTLPLTFTGKHITTSIPLPRTQRWNDSLPRQRKTKENPQKLAYYLPKESKRRRVAQIETNQEERQKGADVVRR